MSASAASTGAPYLSIKDAAQRYQKAEITIRRFVRGVLEKEKAAERKMIHPLPQDAAKMKKGRKPFAYTIAEELLEKHFGAGMNENTPRRATPGVGDPYMELLKKTNEEFAEQLKTKDEQIRVLSQAIDGLSERQRETNILMKGLHEKLLLLPAEKPVVEVQETSPQPWWKLW